MNARARPTPGLILALDPGRRTGWAWSDGSCGTLDLSHNDDLGMLYGEFHGWLADALWARRPRLLAIERPFGRAAFTADLPLVLVGIAHMLARVFDVPRRELTASEIKRRVAGSGRASKGDVIAAVCNDGWAPDSDHAADAAACLMAWRAREVEAAGVEVRARA